MENRIAVLQLDKVYLPRVVPEVAVDDFIQVQIAHRSDANIQSLLKLRCIDLFKLTQRLRKGFIKHR